MYNSLTGKITEKGISHLCLQIGGVEWILLVSINSLDTCNVGDEKRFFTYLQHKEDGMTMFGFSFMIVAIFPTKKSSATAASILHLLSYYVGFMYTGSTKTLWVKLLVCLIPNATLTFMIEHLL